MTGIKWPRDKIAMWQEGQTLLHWFCDGAIYGRKLGYMANSDIHTKSSGSLLHSAFSVHSSLGYNHSLMEFGLIWRESKI